MELGVSAIVPRTFQGGGGWRNFSERRWGGRVPLFIVTVLDIPVATQRRLPTVQTVLKTGEFPQVQFLEKVDDARSCSTTGS